MVHYRKKHKVIKTHNPHMGMVSIIFVFLFIIGAILYVKILSVDSIPEENFKIMSLGLMFTMNIILIILTILFIVFYIEFKDKFLEK